MNISLPCFDQRSRRLSRTIFARSTAALLILSGISATLAQTVEASAAKALSGGSYVITNSTLDAGGGSAIGGSLKLASTIGQPDAVTLSSARYRVQGGFWVDQRSASDEIFRNGFD
jgi:hypothetical protein